ncbi:siderophore-interacting protein [Aquabacterium sp. J223]|uniref:siderophore-interacting protein n=1 Tax=Aquabacterium sp. J223 TaxID=2898431 RepID=UPI0021AD67B0|nr:siderophore-interacting protein [Aquabacterium sp. J223]UUX94451.1 siderophore-interacting protein [Aquabacterium sp. J223]
MTPSSPSLAPQRVRHPLQRRRLTVQRVIELSPHLRRVRLAGPELAGFVSASFDDHVKLMLPSPGQPLVLPDLGPDGPQRPPQGDAGPRPLMRDYTPRRFDAHALTLDIDLVLHGHGPAATWAAQAAPGQEVAIGGPRGSFVLPDGYDWQLLVGDAAALPAIARRLEELPRGTRVAVVLAVAEADRIDLATQADVDLRWVAPGSLQASLAGWRPPAGEGYAWAAGEAREIAALRAQLVAPEVGVPRDRIRAAAYWKQGAAGHHENLGD